MMFFFLNWNSWYDFLLKHLHKVNLIAVLMFNKAFTNALYISYKPLMPSTFGLPGCENYLLQVKPFNQHPLNLSTFSTADFLESLIFFY